MNKMFVSRTWCTHVKKNALHKAQCETFKNIIDFLQKHQCYQTSPSGNSKDPTAPSVVHTKLVFNFRYRYTSGKPWKKHSKKLVCVLCTVQWAKKFCFKMCENLNNYYFKTLKNSSPFLLICFGQFTKIYSIFSSFGTQCTVPQWFLGTE